MSAWRDDFLQPHEDFHVRYTFPNFSGNFCFLKLFGAVLGFARLPAVFLFLLSLGFTRIPPVFLFASVLPGVALFSGVSLFSLVGQKLPANSFAIFQKF